MNVPWIPLRNISPTCLIKYPWHTQKMIVRKRNLSHEGQMILISLTQSPARLTWLSSQQSTRSLWHALLCFPPFPSHCCCSCAPVSPSSWRISWEFLSLGSWLNIFYVCTVGLISIKCHKPQPGPEWLVFTAVFYLTSQGAIPELAMPFEWFFLFGGWFLNARSGSLANCSYNIKFQPLDRLTTQPIDLLKHLHCSVILLLYLRSPTSVPQMASASQHFPASGIQHLQVLPVTLPQPLTFPALCLSSPMLGFLLIFYLNSSTARNFIQQSASSYCLIAHKVLQMGCPHSPHHSSSSVQIPTQSLLANFTDFLFISETSNGIRLRLVFNLSREEELLSGPHRYQSSLTCSSSSGSEPWLCWDSCLHGSFLLLFTWSTSKIHPCQTKKKILHLGDV